ncbi:AGAP003290-PA-like protein [Anopheles sinensis]|uniref:AGAP003290-PA-like protein n=1 Tax=Anopheles sinensis TaxID=74873 RepID=A0A084VNM4_ANOSI|nr:AGAP003290-PA-like protein [Anopheles sinensis]
MVKCVAYRASYTRYSNGAEISPKVPKKLSKPKEVQPGDDIRGPATFPTVTEPDGEGVTEESLSAYELRRQQLLEHPDSFSSDDLKPLRETHINVLHEAIDAKLIDPSFIRTLGTVSDPPKVHDATRDTLTIRSIVEDLNFTLGERVVRWKTMSAKNVDRHVVVGLTNTSLVVLVEHEGQYSLAEELVLETQPIAFEVLTLWDTHRTSAVGCVVISMGNFLVWYTMREEHEYRLDEEWRWPLHKTITQIKFFRQKEVDALLLIGRHPNRHESVSATVYEFAFNERQFWLMQKMGLEHPCPSVGLVPAGDEYLVAFPQNSTVLIYTFRVGDQNRRKFKPVGNYSSEALRSVDAFQIGRYSYIAISGKSPAVLRYKRGRFYAQEIPTESLEIVEAFFEIPARTFRDDMILLVQHRMIFATHEIQRLEALVWNGVSFDLATNIPCMVENEVIDNEVSCMLDVDRTDGLFGGTIVQRGKSISIIVPRHKAHSSLYHLTIELLSGEHPIMMKIQEMKETMEAFTKIIEYQNAVIEQAQSYVALMEGDPVVLKRQNFSTLETPLVEFTEEYDLSGTTIMVGHNNWREADFQVDLGATVNMVQDIELSVDAMLTELQHSVRREARSHDQQINGTIQVQGKLFIDGALRADDMYIQRFEQLPEDTHTRFTRNASQDGPVQELYVKDLAVEQLYFDFFNGIPAEDLVYDVDGKVELEGELVIGGDLYTNSVILPDGGTVNGIDLSESLVYFNCKNRRWKNLTLDSLEVIDDVHVAKEINGAQIDLHRAEKSLRNAIDEQGQVLRSKTLHVEGDLSFERINGIPWKTFLDGLVFKNRPMRLSHLHVEGNVTFGSQTSVEFLNRLRFPDDYVLKQGPRETIITGQKHFQGTLTMDALDIDGFVNNINPFDFITLHDEQYIPGNVTFDSLEIEDSLDVRGAVRGKQMDKFLDNPTLLQTKVLDAACEFDEVIVNGPIYVDHLDGYDLERYLKDVVYIDEPYVEINASKHYRYLKFEEPIRVESNMLGEIHLEDLLTKSTDQTLNISMIVGNVFFNRVQTEGLFAGINVTEWDTNSIKIFGDQHTGATLEFCPEYSLLYANNLEVVGTLNGVPRSGFYDMDEEIVFQNQIVHVSDLYANYLSLKHTTIDSPTNTVNDVHLPTFQGARFSLSQPQAFEEDVYIDTLYVSKSFVTYFLNGLDLKLLQEQVETYLDDDHMLSGKHVLESLHIDGDVEIGMLNGVELGRFLDNVIWLDRPNAVSGALLFLNPLTVEGDLMVEGTLNEMPFKDFLANVVYKNDNDVVEITGSKLFLKGFDVRGDLNTLMVNNMLVKDFVLKNESIVFPGNVVTLGRIYVKELVVSGTINGKSFKPVEAYYAYDNTTDTHVIKGDLYLEGLQLVHNLEALGGWNELHNVSHKLSTLVRTNQDYFFKGHYVFQNELHFKHGFTTDFINGYNISNVHNEIVYYDQTEPIVFSEPVEFYGSVWGATVQVEGHLIGQNLAGVNPDELANDVLLLNKDYEVVDTMVFLPGTFKCDSLNATFINNQPLNELITLHTEQTIDRPVYVKQIVVQHPVQVEGVVNGRDLRVERQNTVMRYGEQVIETPTVFNAIRVLNTMTLPKILNGVPFGDPVLLGETMNITSPISFYQISADEVFTEDTIGGINFDYWYDQTLWADGRVDQEYYGKLRSRKAIFREDILGNGTINGMTVQEIAHHLQEEKKLVEDELAKRRLAYRAACQQTQTVINGTQQRMYFFNYFVQRQTIHEQGPIESFWTFQQQGSHFLVINFGCESKFYQWNPQDRVFVGLFQVHTGYVFEWHTVAPDDDTVLLVTRSAPTDKACNVKGLSIWRFKGLSLEMMKNLPEMDVDGVFVDSQFPDRFYVLDRTNVFEYNATGEVSDQWNLSRVFETASFLPSSLGVGLALSDGSRIAVLSRKEPEPAIRRKRSNEDQQVNLALFTTQMNMQNYMVRNATYYRTNDELVASAEYSEDHPQLTQPDPLNEIGSVQESNDTIIQTTDTSPDLEPIDDRHQLEQRIAKEVPLGRISTTENHHFPDPTAGEVLSFHVGFHGEPKRHLVAVTEAVQTVIKGSHDSVRIYSDILQGHLYQIISCHQPSQLTVLEIRDETILAFLEQRHKVQLYTYRGRKGFVHWNSFNLASPGVQMRSMQLPQTPFFKCKLHYLAIALSSQELMFLKAKTQGDCGINLQLDCGTE